MPAVLPTLMSDAPPMLIAVDAMSELPLFIMMLPFEPAPVSEIEIAAPELRLAALISI